MSLHTRSSRTSLSNLQLLRWISASAAQRNAPLPIIYTIGYEGTDIERFVSTIKSVGIKVIADVRAIPLSRKKGFSKLVLESRLLSAQIEYHSYVALGDPKPGRDAAKTGDYERFRDIYEAHLEGASAQAALEKLVNVAKSNATCLLCFERAPEACHRTLIANRMSLVGFDTCNLFGDDPLRYVRNAKKFKSIRLSQSAAAAE